MAQKLLIISLCLLYPGLSGAATPEKAQELVSNPTFRPAPGTELPAGWSVWTPAWQNAACTIRSTKSGLLIQGKDPYAVGGLTREIASIEPGHAYEIDAACEFRAVPNPHQSVLVRIYWLRSGRPIHVAGMLVRGPQIEGDSGAFHDVLIAPENADAARISIEVKWPQGGRVLFRSIRLTATAKPAPRKVKVGTVFLRPGNSTPEKNMTLWCNQIDAAGKLGIDILCLGETIKAVGTGATIQDRAETIPGRRKKEQHLGNRKPQRKGRRRRLQHSRTNRPQRKPRRQIPQGPPAPRRMAKGRPSRRSIPRLPDRLRLAIQICYDWFFPEPEAIFALKGAEIIFAPTWGNTLPDADGCVNGETVFRVRARDNGVYMVPCVYDGSSMVIDPMGRILVSNKGKTGVPYGQNSREQQRQDRGLLGRDRPEQTRAPAMGRLLALHRSPT